MRPLDRRADEDAFAAAVQRFASSHPMLNVKDPATHLLALIWVGHRYPELLTVIETEFGGGDADEYPKPSQLLEAYRSGVPLTDVMQLASTTPEKQTWSILR